MQYFDFILQPERINPETGMLGYYIKSDVWSFGITMVSIMRNVLLFVVDSCCLYIVRSSRALKCDFLRKLIKLILHIYMCVCMHIYIYERKTPMLNIWLYPQQVSCIQA